MSTERQGRKLIVQNAAGSGVGIFQKYITFVLRRLSVFGTACNSNWERQGRTYAGNEPLTVDHRMLYSLPKMTRGV